MQYYIEFDEHEYYALIAVETQEDNPIHKAVEIYVEQIAGNSVEEVLDEGVPGIVSKSYAFHEFASVYDKSKSVGEMWLQFERVRNDILLIDGSLN